MRLKTARLIFRTTSKAKMLDRNPKPGRRYRRAKPAAMRRLEAGPARAILAESFWGSRRL